ncbi:lipid A deacylase LpxR family protein [Taibaiella soli]|uniref:Lipid A deacylase LpxR family protein n=1 Tax=Taibaiella soli TaxID=1649169 RepID=A0A2W2B3I3_9BACT|nr:lipid A deacylase LpxR family protein [Taibaiella soli]PZF74568.1 hypothetical protein DN068_03045 [Taibaiella soli]
MKKILNVLLFIIFVSANTTKAQNHMIRAYEDNDLLNVISEASDDAYTNGLRLDYYYTKDHKSRFFLDRWLPKAGKDAVNTFGWSAMQLMFTPEYITKTQPDLDDYPYAGALFATHSLHSSNPVKKYNLQSELLVGVMGPASMADKTQILVHRIIGNDRPMGWQYQLPNAALVNFNFAAEKMLFQHRGWLEIIGGGTGTLGTMTDGLSAYSTIRIGKMNPYFDGAIGQFSGKKQFQLYFFMRPEVRWLGYNALVDGAAFRGKSAYYNATDGIETASNANRGVEGNLGLGAVLTWKNIGVSFSQNIIAPMLQNNDLRTFHHHTVGNISVYVSW